MQPCDQKSSVVSIVRVFSPYILGLLGAGFWLVVIVQIARQRTTLTAITSFSLYILVFVILTGITPDRWIQARPTEDQKADIAIILGFGYEINGDQMLAGQANQYLWDWFVANRSFQIRTVLLQEGIWVAADDVTVKELGIERVRIHRHDPNIYVDTLNTAFCAIPQAQKLGKKRILLIAHDLQLQRVVWDFERVGHELCPECIFVIPEISDVPFPMNSLHVQTRSKFIYKIGELLIARPRDFLNRIPTECIAPVDTE